MRVGRARERERERAHTKNSKSHKSPASIELTKLRWSESSASEFSRLRRERSDATSLSETPCSELICAMPSQNCSKLIRPVLVGSSALVMRASC